MYFFLDYNVPEAVGWYLGLLLLHVAFFFGVYGVYRLKARLLGEPHKWDIQAPKGVAPEALAEPLLNPEADK